MVTSLAMMNLWTKKNQMASTDQAEISSTITTNSFIIIKATRLLIQGYRYERGGKVWKQMQL